MAEMGASPALVVVGDERLLRIDISVVLGEAGRNAHDGTLRRAASPRERRIIGLGRMRLIGRQSTSRTRFLRLSLAPVKISAIDSAFGRALSAEIAASERCACACWR